MRYYFCVVLFSFLFTAFAKAQTNDTKITSGALDSLPTLHSPSRAALYSAVLPGLGQIYNKKNGYWKVPLLVVGGATLGFFIRYNNRQHLTYRKSYLAKLYNLPKEQDPYSRITSIDVVRRGMKEFQHNRDLLIILSIGAYGLNVLDAFVEAHLKSFNVDNKLTLRFAPYSENIAGQTLAGVSLKLGFR